MGPVAERFVRRAAAAAEREWPLHDRVAAAVPVHHRHILAVDEVWTVLSHLDRRHRVWASENTPPGSPEGLRYRQSVRLSSFSDRKSTRLNSSHLGISYAVFCLKKKKTHL